MSAIESKSGASGDGRIHCHFVKLSPILVALLLTYGIALAQNPPLTESKLKAAFLFNFAKFVEWPPAAFAATNSPITIGILGDNPFGSDLEDIVRDKTINNRSIVIKTLHSVTQSTNCQVLFFGTTEKKRMEEMIASLGNASILTVGDGDPFTETGGMINFIKEGNKIRFRINEVAAQHAGLKISSKLLSLASRTVR